MNAPQTASSALPNIHDLSAQERAKFMRAEWAKKSRFQNEFGADAGDIACVDFAQGLREQVMRQLMKKGVIKDDVVLEELHKHIPQELKDYNINDGVNLLSSKLYDTDEEFTAEYMRFMKDCLGKYFAYPFYFQETPTVRIHCPNGKNSNHYPRYHSDIGYGHPAQEINIWIPLTVPQGAQHHGFRRASVENSRTILEPFCYDFGPFIDKAVNDHEYNTGLNALAPQVETQFGFAHAFDSRCIHTGEPLLEHTRASIDVRIIPVEDFNRLPVLYQGTGRRRIRYEPGEAYYNLSSDKL